MLCPVVWILYKGAVIPVTDRMFEQANSLVSAEVDIDKRRERAGRSV